MFDDIVAIFWIIAFLITYSTVDGCLVKTSFVLKGENNQERSGAKNDSWNAIEREFNSVTGGSLRTAKQLKMKYEGIEKDIKKKYIDYKKYAQGTGGGRAMSPPTSATEEEKGIDRNHSTFCAWVEK
ncbi:Myb/SANT-like DNA-binding domain [Popillia japonica]|uniref:Regulatory protein zeste n=1 Tax=Popillia japonica TaxID=7064 RepID=A0AAW1LUW3_POPJA